VKRRSVQRAAANGHARTAGRGRGPRNILKVGPDFYILASALASRRHSRVIADGRSFAVFDIGGDIFDYTTGGALGFFHCDTRYLSRFELRVHGDTPYLLNSYLSNDNAQLRINLTNSDLRAHDGTIRLLRDSIQMERSWVLSGATMVHRLRLRNYADIPLEVPIEFLLAADFADVFEVRGVARERRGKTLEPLLTETALEYRYDGLDGKRRFTEVTFDIRPRALSAGRASFRVRLARGESAVLEVRIRGGSEPASVGVSCQTPVNFDHSLAIRRAEIEASQTAWARLSASNELFDSLLKRSQADLLSLISRTGQGGFIMAGIPWFATLFGRDSIITAMAMLPFNSKVAEFTLRALAALQGSRINEPRDEQPGKIVHEIRAGEMAATGEIPFGRYYGSVDSTPLFLWLFARCITATGDLAFAEELWPHVERALDWIERWGDRDGDGYVEYFRETPRGLANQGWKDSADAISHANGELARAPIALAEVQGYVYAAYVGVAEVASQLGKGAMASRLDECASGLKRRFTRDFWLEPERTVALALDADKQPCRVMASNAAHCMATGLLDAEHAGHLGQRLFEDRMFSGWGVRTLGANERRYNPMSYHNGSVWPHDSAIAAMGLARYGDSAGALSILAGLFDAAVHMETASLPELFCGFPREPRLGPVPYPVACYPQAWSAASIFMILQAMMGIEVSGRERRLTMRSPAIPPWLDWLRVDNLQVGDGSVSLMLRRAANGACATEILERTGPVTVDVSN
jgi:glycogen debranching enzyme